MSVLSAHLPNLAERYKVKSLAAFGSYVRNEQTPNSDLDLLVEFDEPPGLFQFIRLENDLTRLVGTNVDLVMKVALKPNIGKRILSEAILIKP